MKPKILIICKSFYNDPSHIHTNKFSLLDEHFKGEYVGLTINKKYKNFVNGDFIIRCLFLPGFIYRLKMLVNACFASHVIFSTVYRHYFVSRYDAIIAAEPLFAGPLAVLISKLTRAKLIVELNGNYSSEHVWNEIKNPTARKLKKFYLRKMIPFVLGQCDAIKTLFSSQVDPYISEDLKNSYNIHCFHDYTPLPKYDPTLQPQNFIMTMGYPYNIKGFDLLILAFNKICGKHPDVELHLVGYLNDTHRSILEELRDGNARVKFVKPVMHPEAMEKMAQCLFFVLASRTEGMGRVLLEAMALKKPLIGSRVDGIPTYLKDDFNGLLFESENIEELSLTLNRLLEDKGLRDRLAEQGYSQSLSVFSEKSYIDQYRRMLLEVIGESASE